VCYTMLVKNLVHRKCEAVHVCDYVVVAVRWSNEAKFETPTILKNKVPKLFNSCHKFSS
jgi:hypothetical protein